ncbi:hypothetical protein SIO70_27835 [Chitinophaga sancti]|uniref:hypothetical protein n=1 Tax=Chitinophaga sancti TaxID=1004 RepID=UPI002A76157C|nr:hypothetical protein [Chitinophaga sancti]WPQ62176.1 hypothetical protein SIO70_27835 [Chitinophaga sancti]
MTSRFQLPDIDNDDFKATIAQTKQAIKTLKENNDTDSLAQAYTHLANAYYHLGNYQKAQLYWKEGNKFIHSKMPPSLVSYSYYTIGIILKAKNKFRLAQQAFINSIKACPENPHPDLLINLSSTQFELHQFDKGRANLERAQHITNESPQLDELAAHYFIQEGKFKQAKQRLQSALKLYKKIFDENNPNVIRVHSSLDQLKSGDENELRIQITTGGLFYSLKEYINIYIALYKQTVDMFGSIKAITKHLTTDQYLHDYQFFSFTKCCKSFVAFSALVNKGTTEDAMVLLYTIYRNYLTMAYLNKDPKQVLSLFKTPNNKPIELIDLVKLSPYPEDKIIHNFLDKYLSNFAYSNFTTSEYYRSIDETYYQYSAKNILIQATEIGLYLQLLIIKEIGTLISNDKWKNLVAKFIREAIPLLVARIEVTHKEDNKLMAAMKKRLVYAN